jgi:CHAT domain-containing protein
LDRAFRVCGAGESTDGEVSLCLLQVEILLARGEYPKASSLLSPLPDPHTQALHLRWLVDRADLLRRQKHQDEALELLDEVDQIAGSKGVGEGPFKSLLLRGAILLSRNKFTLADEPLERLVDRAGEAGDAYYQASALANLALSKLKQLRYDECIDYGRRALDLAEQIHAIRIAGSANDNVGIAYTTFQDLDQGTAHITKAIGQFREVDDRLNLGDAFGELGNIHLLGKQPELAVQDFSHAFDTAQSMEEDSVAAVRWAGRIAFAEIEQKHWDLADSWNQRAYALREHQKKKGGKEPYLQLNAAAIANGLGDSKKAETLYGDLIKESKNVPYVEWNAQFRLGSLLASQHRIDDAKRQFESGLETSERVLADLKDDERLTYNDLQMEFFREYVELLVSERDTDGALKVVEYSHGQLLSERLGVPSGTIRQVQFAAFRSYARKTGSVLLSFWLAPQRSFVWAIKADGIQMHLLPPRKEIADLIRDYQNTVDTRQQDPLEQTPTQAEHLSEVLLGPLRKDLAGATQVVIVPDLELHALNLETLPSPFHAKQYWIEDVEVSIAPSLRVLAEAPSRKPSPPSFLLVGDPVSVSTQYGALPFAKKEIANIKGHYPGAEVLAGPAASPQQVRDALRTPRSMIHFAAHAEANSQRPLESAVILSRSGDAYKLYAREVENLKVSADLVTLSACRSAGARTYGGEGLVGFAWAFLRSGAGAVIAGLWDVGDASSAQLMDKLYESLAAGDPPAKALHKAKLGLLHSGTIFHKPYYWAPYQIYIP